MVLNKKYRVYKNSKAITKRINLLEKLKNKIMKNKVKSTVMKRNLRNIKESLSDLKRARRDWRNFITSMRIFTV